MIVNRSSAEHMLHGPKTRMGLRPGEVRKPMKLTGFYGLKGISGLDIIGMNLDRVPSSQGDVS